MCIAILQKRKAKKITKAILTTCYEGNKDGFGVAYFDKDDALVIDKFYPTGAKEKIVEDIYRSYSKAFDEAKSDIMLHFRFSTAGKKDDQNCHPFEINDQLAMCHNGVISDLSFDDKYSDTYLLADKIIKPNIHVIEDLDVDGDFYVEFIQKLAGNGKLIFLAPHTHRIYNEKAGQWDGNVWYSNGGYKAWTSRGYYPDYTYPKTTHSAANYYDDAYYKDKEWNPVTYRWEEKKKGKKNKGKDRGVQTQRFVEGAWAWCYLDEVDKVWNEKTKRMEFVWKKEGATSIDSTGADIDMGQGLDGTGAVIGDGAAGDPTIEATVELDTGGDDETVAPPKFECECCGKSFPLEQLTSFQSIEMCMDCLPKQVKIFKEQGYVETLDDQEQAALNEAEGKVGETVGGSNLPVPVNPRNAACNGGWNPQFDEMF